MLSAPVWQETNFANAFGLLAKRPDVADVFSRSTGGRREPFIRAASMERILAGIGQELHNQYLLMFSPSRAEPGRFHSIRVAITGRPDLEVRTRAGYWPAAE